MPQVSPISRRAGAAGAALAVSLFGAGAEARSPETDARAGMQAFAANCFSPHLTAARAARVFDLANIRHDFYDLAPFSASTQSLPTGTATAGTDRRCEVSFDGEFADVASEAVHDALASEGIRAETDVPATHRALPGTALLAARKLNPNRTAVVHVGTRQGPAGVETFMNVERLEPNK